MHIVFLIAIPLLSSCSLLGGDAQEEGMMGDPRVVVESPRPQQVISSPLEIRGKARGTWYFEATFPVVLVDWDGLIIAEHYAQADGEWMTPDFVPFTASLEFERPEYGERGWLILRRSNPSGLPEHDAAVEIPVMFAGMKQ